MQKLLRCAKDNRGSALVSVFLVIIVLLVLGMGIMALSVGSAKQAVAVDAYEKVYYPAEGASQQGVEYVRRVALNMYNTLTEQVGNNELAMNNATSFFSAMDTYIGAKETKFVRPAPDTSAGSAVSSLKSDVSSEVVNADKRKYTITSVAEGSGATRTVLGTITITFKPLEKSFSPFGDKALVVGSDLDTTHALVNTDLISPDGVETGYIDGTAISPTRVYDHIDTKDTPVYAPPADRNLDWYLSLGMFSSYIADITPSHTPEPLGHGTNAYMGFEDLSLANMYVVNDTSYELHNVSVSGSGKLVSNASTANLSIYDGTLNNMTIICGGNMYIDGCTLNNCSIFCGGTLYFRAGTSKITKVTGSIIWANNVIVGDVGNGKSEFVSGLLYSYTDITINGDKNLETASFVGQVVSHGDTILSKEIPSKSALFDYDESILKTLPVLLEAMGATPFIKSLQTHNGGTLYTVQQWPNSDIFSGGSVAEN